MESIDSVRLQGGKGSRQRRGEEGGGGVFSGDREVKSYIKVCTDVAKLIPDEAYYCGADRADGRLGTVGAGSTAACRGVGLSALNHVQGPASFLPVPEQS